jgi:predicted phosphodiesterase
MIDMDAAKHDNITSRRSFLKTVSFCSGACLFQPFAFGSSKNPAVLRFGLIADVHQDVMHDGPQRIEAFTEEMNEAKADFICQLGDFCWPHERNRGFLERWRQFDGPRHHVLGNHDMDGGYTRDHTVAFLGMPGKHYSFDKQGVHVMVLDGNETGGKSEGYKRYISKKQLSWISKDLRATLLPTIVFTHQALDHSTGVENSEDVRKTLEEAKTKTGQKKVVACFCGHHHDDQAKHIDGIHYIRINSASYAWLGGEFKHESYGKDIHRDFPWISHTAPYKDPLWAFVEMDVTKGRLVVRGRKTSWVGPTPWELGIDKETKDPNVCAPRISDRACSFWNET